MSSTPSLESNAIPALAIVGQFDPERPDVDELKKVMSSLKVEAIDGATHFTATSAPRFVEISLEFLRRQSGKQ
jgi:pimeloyl-ACP methyl ester carboxylesterase